MSYVKLAPVLGLFVVSAALLLSSLASAAPQEPRTSLLLADVASAGRGEPAAGSLKGDVNCDGFADSIDAALLLQHQAGLHELIFCASGADVNGDGSVDAIDAALTLQVEAALIAPIHREIGEAALAVTLATADMTDVRKEQVVFASQERQTWPDGCLGLGEKGEACTEALVEGYRIKLTVWYGPLPDPLESPTAVPIEGYSWRTNLDGSVIRLEAIAVP